MNVNTLREFIKNKIEPIDFDFSAATKQYNPIEFFLEKLVQKETAHSKLLADLLNPNGQHGQGTQFLDFFIKRLGIEEQTKDINLSLTFIKTEYSIPTTSSDDPHKKVNGRIDILLKCYDNFGKNKLTLIIENKLNGALFGKRQLEKYKEAIQNEENSAERIYVITLQIYGTTKEDKADFTMYNTDVSSFIEDALNANNTPSETKDALKCYINYLRNINMDNKALENAMELIKGLKAEDICKMKAIKEAYEQLPAAYAIKFIDDMKDYCDMNSISIENDHYYPTYVDVWRPKDGEGNDMSWRWIAIGFYHDCVCYYLVTNRRSEEEIKRYAECAGVEKSSYASGWTWHKLDNLINCTKCSSSMENAGVPDFETIKCTTISLLEELDKADKKFNSDTFKE